MQQLKKPELKQAPTHQANKNTRGLIFLKNSSKKIELLSPAGDITCLKTAVEYGADAVYVGGQGFSMRTSPKNFSHDDMCSAISFAHKNNVKVYVTCNTLPRNNEIALLPSFFDSVKESGADALIISDIGVLMTAKKHLPDIELHVSTQLGVVNYLTAKELYNMGASRVVVARELSLDEICEIRVNTPKELEIEAFVHGSMCVSFSGRCLLSSYLTGRDANRGDCSQPCRWKYNLVEETRPDTFFPIAQNEDGTHILNSSDMCMIEHIDKLYNAGITSFKIEGRAKAEYYVALTTNAYRHAIDGFLKNPSYKTEQWIIDELDKISHREYGSGFYFGHEPKQVYENGGYIRNYQVVGIVSGYEDGHLIISQRNKFEVGSELEILEPKSKFVSCKVLKMLDSDNNEIQSAPHAMMTVKIPFDKKIKNGSYIRMKIK